MATPSDQQIKERIQEIVHPATLAQVSYCERTDTSHLKEAVLWKFCQSCANAGWNASVPCRQK